jgi:mycothiol synthase
MITLRTFNWEDLCDLVEVTSAAATIDPGQERYTEETLREELTNYNDPEKDCFVAVTPEGHIVGYSYDEYRDDEDRQWGYGWITMHPDHRFQGIEPQLLRAADARFLDQMKLNDKVVFLQRFLNAKNTNAIALAQAEGYHELRSSYRMSITLDKSLKSVDLPKGFKLRPFAPKEHGHAVHEVDQAAFMDGGGLTFRTPYEEWHKRFIEVSYFNPDLWLIAWEQDKVAGVSISQPWGEDDPELGWIAHLAVLREYRGQGLGEALLRNSFVALRKAGYKRAALGVRADKPSALALYERAGMEIYTQFVHYRKVFRGDPQTIES